MNDLPTVFIADDDPAALKSLKWLLESVGLIVCASDIQQEMFDQSDPQVEGFVFLDLRMP